MKKPKLYLVEVRWREFICSSSKKAARQEAAERCSRDVIDRYKKVNVTELPVVIDEKHYKTRDMFLENENGE